MSLFLSVPICFRDKMLNGISLAKVSAIVNAVDSVAQRATISE